MIFLWPVSIPVLYALLLWLGRHALLKGEHTTLSDAIAFRNAKCFGGSPSMII